MHYGIIYVAHTVNYMCIICALLHIWCVCVLDYTYVHTGAHMLYMTTNISYICAIYVIWATIYFSHICLFKKYILHIVHIIAHMMYICGEYIIVVYGSYELSFSF